MIVSYTTTLDAALAQLALYRARLLGDPILEPGGDFLRRPSIWTAAERDYLAESRARRMRQHRRRRFIQLVLREAGTSGVNTTARCGLYALLGSQAEAP